MYNISKYQQEVYVMKNNAKNCLAENYRSTDFRINGTSLISYRGPGGNVIVPEGVTIIDMRAFSRRDNITSIKLPKSLVEIESYAFSDITSLTSIKIPNGVTEIAPGTFSGCDELVAVELPEGITKIGQRAFYRCENLKSISLPSTVNMIDKEAFWRCKNLTYINLRPGITIGGGAFKDTPICAELSNNFDVTIVDTIE